MLYNSSHECKQLKFLFKYHFVVTECIKHACNCLRNINNVLIGLLTLLDLLRLVVFLYTLAGVLGTEILEKSLLLSQDPGKLWVYHYPW